MDPDTGNLTISRTQGVASLWSLKPDRPISAPSFSLHIWEPKPWLMPCKARALWHSCASPPPHKDLSLEHSRSFRIWAPIWVPTRKSMSTWPVPKYYNKTGAESSTLGIVSWLMTLGASHTIFFVLSCLSIPAKEGTRRLGSCCFLQHRLCMRVQSPVLPARSGFQIKRRHGSPFMMKLCG